MAAHSLFSASKAKAWGLCPGRLALEQVIERTALSPGVSQAALDGTACHALQELCLKDGSRASDHAQLDVVSDGAKRVHVFTKEQHDHVQFCIDHIKRYQKQMNGLMLLEYRVNYANVLKVPQDEAFGTSDIVLIAFKPGGRKGILHIIDSKFGFHYVSAEDNPQLMLYAAAVVEASWHFGIAFETIKLTILQPKATETPSSVEMFPGVLAEKLVKYKEAAAKAKLAQKELAVVLESGCPAEYATWADRFTVVGDEQCQFCPAKHTCPAFQAVVNEVIQQVEVADVNEFPLVAGSLEPGKLRRLLEISPLVEKFLKAVNAEAHNRCLAGDTSFGKKLIAGRAGNRFYANPDDALVKLTGAFTAAGFAAEDLLTPAQLKSVAEVEKLLKPLKLKIEDVIDVDRKPASPKMVDLDVDGQPWSGMSLDDFPLVPEN